MRGWFMPLAGHGRGDAGRVVLVLTTLLGLLALAARLQAQTAGTWRNTAASSAPALRIGQTATPLPSGLVLVAGGYNRIDDLALAELYDPATATWSTADSTGHRIEVSRAEAMLWRVTMTKRPPASLHRPVAAGAARAVRRR